MEGVNPTRRPRPSREPQTESMRCHDTQSIHAIQSMHTPHYQCYAFYLCCTCYPCYPCYPFFDALLLLLLPVGPGHERGVVEQSALDSGVGSNPSA